MEIGFRGGMDIVHVWNSQFLWMKMGWSVCPWCTSISICVCKLTDEHTNGICVFLRVR